MRPMKKILIAFYSKDGNTKRMAELLRDKVNGDLYEIKVNRHYSDNDWTAMDEANAEIKNHDLPPVTSPEIDVSPYDVVLIGGPVWGWMLSTPLMSFLQKTDFKGNRVSAFWTFYDHDEQYDKTMKAMIKNGDYCSGLPMPRNLVNNRSRLNKAIDDWLMQIEETKGE